MSNSNIKAGIIEVPKEWTAALGPSDPHISIKVHMQSPTSSSSRSYIVRARPLLQLVRLSAEKFSVGAVADEAADRAGPAGAERAAVAAARVVGVLVPARSFAGVWK